MVKNDEGIVKLKHHIVEEVCRLAWKNELTPENEEQLVYKISPGIRSARSTVRGSALPRVCVLRPSPTSSTTM